ncbi:Peptidyl-tRNA hydrolase [Burkholderiales bacterium]|nr:Peptidyl-tRNA hydrolase [Burkholderiales bacterium]
MAASAPIRLVAGLGNPGRGYERTRHNAGYWYADALAARLGATFAPHARYSGDVARVGEVRLVKPATYMNESGRSVGALARFLDIAPEEILVVHDELDLPAGGVKLKLGGGVAGHNGLKDVRAHLATPGFWRLRIGIGHPRDSDTPRQQVVDYVLKPPRGDERDAIRGAIDRALDAWPAIAAGDFERAMMQLHTRDTP